MNKEIVKKVLLDKTCRNCHFWEDEIKICEISELVWTEDNNEYGWCDLWEKK